MGPRSPACRTSGGVGREFAAARIDPPKSAGVVAVDQAPIKESRRSNPATYTGAPSNANLEGACPTRNGNGVIYTDLGIIANVAS